MPYNKHEQIRNKYEKAYKPTSVQLYKLLQSLAEALETEYGEYFDESHYKYNLHRYNHGCKILKKLYKLGF